MSVAVSQCTRPVVIKLVTAPIGSCPTSMAVCWGLVAAAVACEGGRLRWMLMSRSRRPRRKFCWWNSHRSDSTLRNPYSHDATVLLPTISDSREGLQSKGVEPALDGDKVLQTTAQAVQRT
jgi:hypothetical protein